MENKFYLDVEELETVDTFDAFDDFAKGLVTGIAGGGTVAVAAAALAT